MSVIPLFVADEADGCGHHKIVNRCKNVCMKSFVDTCRWKKKMDIMMDPGRVFLFWFSYSYATFLVMIETTGFLICCTILFGRIVDSII